MDTRTFEKFPHLAPLLVRLHESHELYRLAKEKDPRAQSELTAAITNLLEVDLSTREQELLADVLISLTRQAEKDLRAALSERLATMPNVPLRLVLHLANDEEICVARPVLMRSAVLTDLDLIYILKSQGPEYWQAIAERENLSFELIDVLADTQNIPTAIILSKNERIRLTEHAMAILSEMAKGNEAIARPLLARPEIPEGLARSLYKYVGQELKAYLDIYFETLDEAMHDAVDDVLAEFSVQVSEYMPSDIMVGAADKFAALGMLNLKLMMESLQRGQIANFIAYFARYTGLKAKRVHDFLEQTCPKGMAIACRAYGVQKGDFSRIYLMTNRMRSKNLVVNHKDMLETLSYFDKIKPDVALRLVKGQLGSSGVFH